MEKYNKSDRLLSLGLVLVIIGMQFGTALKNVLGGVELVNLIMLIAVLMIIDLSAYRNIFLMPRAYFPIFLISVLLLLRSIVEGSYTQQLVFFHLFIIALLLSLCTRVDKYTLESFPKYLFYVSGFVSVVVAFQATNGFTQFNNTFTYSGGSTSKLWMAYGGDPITMSRACVICIIACLLYKSKNAIGRIFKIVFLASAAVGLLSFTNRATVIGTFIILILYTLYELRYSEENSKFKVLLVVMSVAFICYLLYTNIPFLKEQLDSILERVIPGINSLLGINKDVVDGSTSTRYTLRQEALDRYNLSENGFIDVCVRFFAGNGYNFKFLDCPALQIITDCGIIIGIVYFITLIAIPILKNFNLRRNATIFERAVALFAIQMVLDQFYCGSPYFYFYWTPAILLIFSRLNVVNKEDE